MVGQDALWLPQQRYVEADDSVLGPKMLVVGSSGWNWMPAPLYPRGEALLILINIHTSARNAVSFHQQAFVLLDELDFFSDWHIYNNNSLIPKHKLCKEKKIVYLKSAKEQHFFMPQQLLKFSISLFPYYLRKKFLTSYLSFWLMLRTVMTFAHKPKFSSLVVCSILRFKYNKFFPSYKILCHSFSLWSVGVIRSSWNPQ